MEHDQAFWNQHNQEIWDAQRVELLGQLDSLTVEQLRESIRLAADSPSHILAIAILTGAIRGYAQRNAMLQGKDGHVHAD